MGEDGLFALEAIKIYKRIFQDCQKIFYQLGKMAQKLNEKIKSLNIDIILNKI